MWRKMRTYVSRKNIHRLIFDPQCAIFSMFLLLIAEVAVNILVIKKIKCKLFHLQSGHCTTAVQRNIHFADLG